jgi:hypothetical protein
MTFQQEGKVVITGVVDGTYIHTSAFQDIHMCSPH